MKIAELLKLKSAAKAWLGLLAVAAQVALTYLPDHSGYYTAVQVLTGVLSIIGIYAVPNRVAAAKQAVDQVLASGLKDLAATAKAGADGIQVLRDAAAAAVVAPVETPVVTDTPAPVTDPAAAPVAPVATPIQKDTPAP